MSTYVSSVTPFSLLRNASARKVGLRHKLTSREVRRFLRTSASFIYQDLNMRHDWRVYQKVIVSQVEGIFETSFQ